ncbi:MAG: hypothetical protein MJZ25_09030 [Fibrobacter sp.]|nr:hypothetical protein [Fibrobacter sp.]
MVAHVTVKSVDEVDEFLNKNNIPLDKVKITHYSTRMGGKYAIFYNTEDVK